MPIITVPVIVYNCTLNILTYTIRMTTVCDIVYNCTKKIQHTQYVFLHCVYHIVQLYNKTF